MWESEKSRWKDYVQDRTVQRHLRLVERDIIYREALEKIYQNGCAKCRRLAEAALILTDEINLINDGRIE